MIQLEESPPQIAPRINIAIINLSTPLNKNKTATNMAINKMIIMICIIGLS